MAADIRDQIPNDLPRGKKPIAPPAHCDAQYAPNSAAGDRGDLRKRTLNVGDTELAFDDVIALQNHPSR
jgi:hypothetical protein